MSPKAFFATNTGPGSTSFGLLVLRAAALSLFLRHGLEKLTGYSTTVQDFPDPIHIGAHASLGFALLSDGICSVLVMIGLATRPAATVILIDLLAAFFFVITPRIFPTSRGTRRALHHHLCDTPVHGSRAIQHRRAPARLANQEIQCRARLSSIVFSALRLASGRSSTGRPHLCIG